MSGPPGYEAVKGYDEEEHVRASAGGSSSTSYPPLAQIPYKDVRKLAEFFRYDPDEHTEIKKYVRIVRELEQEVPQSALSLQGRIGKVYNDLYEFYDPTELDELVTAGQSLTNFDDFLIKVSSTLGADAHLPSRIVERRNLAINKECEMVGVVFIVAIISLAIVAIVVVRSVMG